ncbi:hypothetical protein K4L06_14650 [Lysobacter sp. BMK333-48F3]|uniref:hypothetical protein n=1 Tax=Lysobacter sp. BMK333-48F3 TaxID=2867962 RepID=UPI001C8C8B2B|nr:hypothetical protein [Lysobacter sp. BMK333-48F3]MBX9402547.1 hypothetical protein [Lysobacter sp. BMK333-48F3]
MLAGKLEAVRQLPAQELAALAGGPALEWSVDLAGEQISVEVVVAWEDPIHSAVRITGHARGPSTWHHQHLRESIRVAIAQSGSDDA